MSRTLGLFAVLLVLALVVGCKSNSTQSTETPPPPPPGATASSAQVTDPVCGMQIRSDNSVTGTHEGQTWHFCSQACLEKFNADPARYVGSAPAPRERGY